MIYDFIGETYFEHDYNNVEFSHDEFDYTLGVKGLHTVKRKVEFKQRRSILPPDLFKKYSDMAFWRDTRGTSASVVAAKASDKPTRRRKESDQYQENVFVNI